jgi:hypothetical protein
MTNDVFVAALDGRGSGVSMGDMPVWIPVLMTNVLGIMQEEHFSLLL